MGMNIFAMNGAYDTAASPQSPVPGGPVPRATPPSASAPSSPMTSTAGQTASPNITISWVALVVLAVLTRIFIEKTGTKVN